MTHKKVKMTNLKLVVWLTVVLGVTTGCIITVKECIDNLISDPTATTISSIRHHALTFPAVTVCNLNSFTSEREKFKERNVTDLLQLTALLILLKHCEDVLESVSQSDNLNLGYEELIMQARHHVEDFILSCSFADKPCGDITEPIITPRACARGKVIGRVVVVVVSTKIEM